jgi:hypothetical protein
MKIFLAFVLFGASFASAQLNFTPGPQPWTCDNGTRLDDQGNPCVNFTTTPHPYQQVTFNNMNWNSEDGAPIGISPLTGVQEYGDVYTSYGNLQAISIADDPLKTFVYPPLNIPFVNAYGWPSTGLSGFTTQESVVANPDGSQDVTYVFTAPQNEDVSFFPLTFHWQGTFTVHQIRIVLPCSGRGGHRPCYGFSTGVGKGELSAIPVLEIQ